VIVFQVTHENLESVHERLVKFRGTSKPFIVTACLFEEGKILIALAATDWSFENPDWTTYRFTTDEEFMKFLLGIEFVDPDKHPELSQRIIAKALK